MLAAGPVVSQASPPDETIAILQGLDAGLQPFGFGGILFIPTFSMVVPVGNQILTMQELSVHNLPRTTPTNVRITAAGPATISASSITPSWPPAARAILP